MQQAVGGGPRLYPHLVTLGAGRNVRWLMEVGEGTSAGSTPIAHVFHGAGAINDAGEVTPVGRRLILDGLRRSAEGSRSTACVVWGDRACTFVMPDGSTVDGTRPPEGDPVYPEDYDRVRADVVDVRYVRLPEDVASPFLCVRQLDAGHVEVSSGSPMVLGHFDELPTTGPGSELRRHLDDDGRLVPPPVFRGVRTAGVENGHTLLGPVQPDGRETRIVEPWPQRVFAAAEEIAGARLPVAARDAVWRALEPAAAGLVLVGAVEVAWDRSGAGEPKAA